MFRIALCDNCIEDLNALGGMIHEWQTGCSSLETQLVCFDKPAKLWQTLTHNFYDLYILDILMPDISGIMLGREIRKTNLNVPIIYTTSSREYALEAYDIKACRYLVKPITQTDVNEALDYICRIHTGRTMHPVNIRSGQELITVAREEIMYIENRVRTSVYMMKDGRQIAEKRRSGFFEDAVQPAVKDGDFIQTHKSYFVNMNYIRSMTSNSIEMDDGTHIPINRRRAENVERKYLAFISKEGNQK